MTEPLDLRPIEARVAETNAVFAMAPRSIVELDRRALLAEVKQLRAAQQRVRAELEAIRMEVSYLHGVDPATRDTALKVYRRIRVALDRRPMTDDPPDRSSSVVRVRGEDWP